MARPRIAYAGVPGAFAEVACLAFRPDHEPVGYPGFAEAVAAVLTGNADCAAIPVENLATGLVPGVAELLDRSDLKIVSEHNLAVAMHCLALPGVSRDDIVEVRSHPVALRQCSRFLEQAGWKQIDDTNTAAAAKELRDSGAQTRAVLASESTAELYGLDVLAHDVQDRADNRTRIAIVERA